MALAGIEQELSAASDKDRRLSQILSTVQDKYDFCVIDCPPSIGLLTFNAATTTGRFAGSSRDVGVDRASV